MNNNNTFANDLKRSILKFSDSISIGLKVPKRKFVRDMIYGILASKSVQLASIGRSLNESIGLVPVLPQIDGTLR